MSFQELGNFHGILVVSFHAHVEGFQPTMKEKCVKRRLQKVNKIYKLQNATEGAHKNTDERVIVWKLSYSSMLIRWTIFFNGALTKVTVFRFYSTLLPICGMVREWRLPTENSGFIQDQVKA